MPVRDLERLGIVDGRSGKIGNVCSKLKYLIISKISSWPKFDQESESGVGWFRAGSMTGPNLGPFSIAGPRLGPTIESAPIRAYSQALALD